MHVTEQKDVLRSTFSMLRISFVELSRSVFFFFLFTFSRSSKHRGWFSPSRQEERHVLKLMGAKLWSSIRSLTGVCGDFFTQTSTNMSVVQEGWAPPPFGLAGRWAGSRTAMVATLLSLYGSACSGPAKEPGEIFSSCSGAFAHGLSWSLLETVLVSPRGFVGSVVHVLGGSSLQIDSGFWFITTRL